MGDLAVGGEIRIFLTCGTNTDQVLACHVYVIVVSIAFTSSLVWGEPDKGFTPAGYP